jgi:polysaccharide export outer membrane protein
MTIKSYCNLVFIGLIVVLLNSCGNVNSNALFKIPKDGSFKYDSLVMNPTDDYILGPGDRFSFQFATNEGERIIFNQSGISELIDGNENLQNQQSRLRIDYLVRQDGKTNLPLVGEITVKGLTLVQLEDSISHLLSKNFINPFVQIRLSNQRVFFFGDRGVANVIYLTNTNTSLIEVIALAGGISENSRSNSIKVMRRTNSGKREIYKIDLSTINGLKEAEMIVQGNDYIYIDYKPRIASSIFKEVGPWLSLVTTSLAVIAIFSK